MGEESQQSATTNATNTHPPPSKLPSRPKKLRKLTQTQPISRATTIPRSLSTKGELETAIRHLKSSDPLLAPLITTHPPPTLQPPLPPFLALTKSILFQQLAFKAGSSIYTRFLSLCGGADVITPTTVLSLTPHQLRQIGVSARKATYLHDLARKYHTGILSDKAILEMDDKSLFTMLTMVNGIGSWSVYMFMIFSLHRPDVLPIHDLGIRRGVQMLYGLEALPRPTQMDQLCEKWRPYRSVAAWYIWRLVETKGAGSKVGDVENCDASLQQPMLPMQQHTQFLDPVNGILNLGVNNGQKI